MIITKAEAMKAVIDGITIHRAFSSSPDICVDYFGSTSYTLLKKLESINNTDEDRTHFRIKPKTKSVQYRNYLIKDSDKYCVECWDGTGFSPTEFTDTKGPYFVKWLGDTVTIEVELQIL